MPEEVLADLRVPQRLHVVGGAVDAAAGLVDAEHADALVVGAGGEFAREVRVEALGAEGEEDVDCGEVSLCVLQCVERKRVDDREIGNGSDYGWTSC